MNSRTELLLSRVRLLLKKENQAADEDYVLYDVATTVQDDIFLDATIEKPFNIILKPGTNKYDFAEENKLRIVNVSTNWKEKFSIVANSEWNKYKYATGAHPIYGTIFGQELYVSPTPTLNNDILEIWAEQIKTINAIDDDIPPELPELFDNALLYGVVAHYVPDYSPKYLDILARAISRYENKTFSIPVPDADWIED